LTEALRGHSIRDIAALDEDKVVELVGGLTPGQRHCAALAVEVLRQLVEYGRGA
jgi:hypothetical protein